MKIRPLPAFVRRRGTISSLLGMVMLSGCASSIDRRADAWGGEGSTRAGVRQPVASQGGSWEMVFQSPGVSAELAGLEPGPEHSRRDGALNPRGNEPVTAMSNWPESPRADLARSRSVRVKDSTNSFIYYFPTGDRRGSSGGTSDRPTWWY